jgi:hypothetical protein
MDRYVDTRGVWPVYVCGYLAVQLRNIGKDITVEDAEVAARLLLSK